MGRTETKCGNPQNIMEMLYDSYYTNPVFFAILALIVLVGVLLLLVLVYLMIGDFKENVERAKEDQEEFEKKNK
eukprot:TRINITY_DN29310_c0_g1_i1.p1 TRINITY_DN29310_c0_g1~~TRINITY_DN29310_c0_g1_i1.p1  ORF type:complete len:74 (-),score=17.15 TRINITY_DN29310_c0_g1_i1:38-259(-)